MQFLWHLYTVFVYCFSSIVYFSDGFVYSIPTQRTYSWTIVGNIHLTLKFILLSFWQKAYLELILTHSRKYEKNFINVPANSRPNSCFALLIFTLFIYIFFPLRFLNSRYSRFQVQFSSVGRLVFTLYSQRMYKVHTAGGVEEFKEYCWKKIYRWFVINAS